VILLVTPLPHQASRRRRGDTCCRRGQSSNSSKLSLGSHRIVHSEGRDRVDEVERVAWAAFDRVENPERVESLLGALGALAPVLPEFASAELSITFLAALEAMFVVYGQFGLAAFVLYRRLPRAAADNAGPVKHPLGPSRRIAFTLEEPFDVVRRFSPAVAEDARSYQFHLSQTNQEQADGALVVRFRAGGAEEMCWHLFTWTPELKVIAPDGLRRRYLEMLEAARVSIGKPGEAFPDRDPGGLPF
jgi:hypothetical protein